MVSSTHWLASATAMSMLERGGNAFDAAVAAGFTLQVVEPHLNGPGGEVPILLYDADRKEVEVIDGQGPAPAAAIIPFFHGLGIDLIPGTGLLPACVPGAFGAWLLLLQRYGTLRLADVLEHAIGYAGAGHPLVPRAAATIGSSEGVFRDEWPTSAEIYLQNGPPRAGEMLSNRSLAETYARILRGAERAAGDRQAQIEHARQSFYEGFVAEAIADFCSGEPLWDGTGEPHRGLLDAQDLATWKARVESSVTRSFGDCQVHKCGPWTQGPVFLQQLGLIEGVDLAGMDHNSADHIHTVVEAAKLAFADREAFYGDPEFVDVPLGDLLADDYCTERRSLISDDASLELRPGRPGGREPRLPPVTERGSSLPGHLQGVGEPTRGDTCHVAVVDRHGNMVAATPSGGWLQSSPAIPGLGFCLGTRAQMFWLTEGLAASLAPSKRPRTTLTPSLVYRDGLPYLAFGTPGGDTQDQWSFNFFLNHVVFGLDLQAAIDAPMFHSNHFPSSFYPRAANPGQIEVETRVGEEVIAELSRRGHHVIEAGPWSLGRLCAVGREPSGVLKAAANPRGMQGYAAGR